MRIAFNAHRLAGQRLGVGRYIEDLLRHWIGMLRPSETVTLFLRRPLAGADEANLRLSDAIRPAVLGPDLPGIPWENLCLRGAAARFDVLFCPAYTAPLYYRRPFVVATHSVNEVQPVAHSRWYPYTYGRLYQHAARRADAVVVPAESTKADVVRQYGVAPERIVVIPQGTDEVFRPLNDPGALRAVRERYFGSDRPYILFVGKCSARRNIPALIEAFAILRRRNGIPHGLLLFGPNTAGFPLHAICERLGVAEAVVQTDGVIADHTDLVGVYNAADVFVHPSEYEGWSMTTVEALACGTAVVASDRGGLGEVARGHALMVASPSAAALADAIGQVLGDDALRQDLKRRARARGQSLTWRDTSQRTLDVLRAVAGQ
jgi:glycosyltransferase involved in cell wall biosynthesis